LAPIPLIKQLLEAKSRSVFVISLVLLVLPTGNEYLINPLLLAVLLNTLISVKGSDWLAALKNPVFLLPAVFYAYYASTILWADNKTDAGLQLETKLTLFAATLVMAANKRHLLYAKQLNLMAVFVLGNVVTMIYAFAYAAYRTYSTGSFYHVLEDGAAGGNFFIYTELSADIMHVGYLSTYVGVALIISLYLAIWGEAKRKIWGLVSVFLLISLIMLQGRINVLAFILVVGIATLAYAIKQKAYKWLVVPVIPIALFALVLAFGPESLSKRFLQVPDFSYDITAPAEEFNSATYRLAEWAGAALVISEHPLFGTGVGDNREALQAAYSELGFHVGVERHYNAHNQYLETTIASGFVGLVLLILLITGYLRLAYNRGDYAMVLALLFFAFCMLTESMLERAWAVVLFSVFFPVMLLAAREPQKTANKKS
jgi:O-antigen ligase